MQSATTTDSHNIVKPDSEKKLLCVKFGLRTKSFTQSRTPRTSSSLMATRPELQAHGSQESSTGTPETTEAHEENKTTHGNQNNMLIGYNTYFVEVLASTETNLCGTKRQDFTYIRAALRGRPLQLLLFLHKRLVFRPAHFKFYPSGQPFCKSPFNSLLNSWKGATSSPPTTIAGQNQLKPCPITDLKATVDRTQITNSSTKRQASRQNSLRRYWLPTLSNAATTRVPERKSFSSIAGKLE